MADGENRQALRQFSPHTKRNVADGENRQTLQQFSPQTGREKVYWKLTVLSLVML